MQTEQQNITVLFGEEYATVLRRLIDEARESIKIVMFDWRWYPQNPTAPIQLVNQAILRAKRRRLDVRAVVDTDSSVEAFAELGLEVRRYFGRGLLHAKFFVIDGRFVVLGSHNLTNNALTYNQETSVLLCYPPTAQQLVAYFDQLWRSSDQ